MPTRRDGGAGRMYDVSSSIDGGDGWADATYGWARLSLIKQHDDGPHVVAVGNGKARGAGLLYGLAGVGSI